jgi:hypothetical protein
MRRIEMSVPVVTDGEIRIVRKELRAGQRVDAKLLIRGRPRRRGSLSLRGVLKGTWKTVEKVERYLRNERESWDD